jgi:hypothetical protein
MQLASKLNDELIICNVVPLCPKQVAAFGSIELAATIMKSPPRSAARTTGEGIRNTSNSRAKSKVMAIWWLACFE